jgi:DNA (cytosine-5)-methyltransferase 1
MSKKIKLVDLFAGTGAFSLAFENTGRVKTIYANDIDKHSKSIYDENFNTKLHLGDITEIDVKDIPKMNILTAGFPCQPFSIAGNQNGFNDERSNVFWKIMEIMKIHKPRIVILENVKNLKSHDKGNTFKVIVDNIEKLNYKIKYNILNTCKITNIPQNRERIYIVCFRHKKDYNKFEFPDEITDRIKIKDLLENNIKEEYYYKENCKIWDKLKNDVKDTIDTDAIYQYRRYYVRKNKSNVCPTLTANMGTGGHNVPIIKDSKGIRKLTPIECFNFQGFPSNYKIPDKLSNAQLYKLAGNAISVPVVEKIADNIVKLFE